MASAAASIMIDKPVEHVFAYVTDVTNHPTWQAGILEATITPAGPVAVGSIYQYTTEVMGNKYESRMEVTGYEMNSVWAVSTTGVPNPVETVYKFEDTGDGTMLSISMELPESAYPAAALPTIKAQMETTLAASATKIKEMSEG